MPLNNMSVGKDYTLAFYDANLNQVVDIGSVQNFKWTAMKHDIANRPYNAPPSFAFSPDGYSCTFDIVRTSPVLENYMLAVCQNFEAGVPSVAGYINETIVEADGSVSKYQYQGFVFWINDLGTVTRETAVKQQAIGMASLKVPL